MNDVRYQEIKEGEYFYKEYVGKHCTISTQFTASGEIRDQFMDVRVSEHLSPMRVVNDYNEKDIKSLIGRVDSLTTEKRHISFFSCIGDKLPLSEINEVVKDL